MHGRRLVEAASAVNKVCNTGKQLHVAEHAVTIRVEEALAVVYLNTRVVLQVPIALRCSLLVVAETPTACS
jgi:hypothetical protein